MEQNEEKYAFMNFREMCEYISEGKLFDITLNLDKSFQKIEDRFMDLSVILFNKENTRKFSRIIPKKYHPWNVSKRVQNSRIFIAPSIYEEAVRIYESLLLSSFKN